MAHTTSAFAFGFWLLDFGCVWLWLLPSARCWPLVACTDDCCRTKVGRSNPSQCAHQAPEREAARVGELARGLRSAGHADRLRREAREVRALSNPTASTNSWQAQPTRVATSRPSKDLTTTAEHQTSRPADQQTSRPIDLTRLADRLRRTASSTAPSSAAKDVRSCPKSPGIQPKSGLVNTVKPP